MSENESRGLSEDFLPTQMLLTPDENTNISDAQQI